MSGILSGPPDWNGPARRRPTFPNRPVKAGETLRHRSTGTVGVAIRVTADLVVMRDRRGREHQLPITPGGFSIDGQAVTVRPAPAAPTAPTTSNSGSVAVDAAAARVARPSRLWVEGKHDAELISHIWGHDLAIEGIVVEALDGADDLSALVRGFGPRPGRRLGVLLDHLVDGSKETRIAAEVDHPDVLIRGHPYVDIWAAIRPQVIGRDSWPVIPRGIDWKTGMLAELGYKGTPGEFWVELRNRVRTWNDVETPLVRSVEELIDFVTA